MDKKNAKNAKTNSKSVEKNPSKKLKLKLVKKKKIFKGQKNI